MKLQVGEKRIVNDLAELSERPIFASIKTIPVQMLSCEARYRGFADTMDAEQNMHELVGQCQTRCFERLPGYIDIDIWSVDGLDTLLVEPLAMAVPACKCVA